MKTTSHPVVIDQLGRAILVSLIWQKLKHDEFRTQYSLLELIQLAETAGVEVLETMTQSKDKADSKWFMGKGKVQELKLRLEELEANVAIFDQELSGSQVRNLEAALDVKIIDRTQLILDIFAQRAKTREGITQVELAQLKYLLPRLSGQGKNLSRLGAGIGSRGPGETKLETDRRHIRDRIDELSTQLEEVVKHRNLHREHRKKSGIFQVALVGYTNAGKSTYLRQLTQADVLVENKLFATLDPTSRIVRLPGGKQIILTDTVGFIQNLPHDVVASFRATLEEVNQADLILHIVDSSSPMYREQIRTVNQVLAELGANQKEQVIIFNKIDLCEAQEVELLSADAACLKLSAYVETDLQQLLLMLENKLMNVSTTFRIPMEKGDLHALVYRIGDVIHTLNEENELIFQVRVNQQDYEKWGNALKSYEVDTNLVEEREE
jgi:GTP-binding protein HflX